MEFFSLTIKGDDDDDCILLSDDNLTATIANGWGTMYGKVIETMSDIICIWDIIPMVFSNEFNDGERPRCAGIGVYGGFQIMPL